MKLTQYLVLTVLLLSVSAVEAQQPPATKALVEQKQCQMPSLPKKARMPRASNIPRIQPVIPPVTVLHNPEYLSGEASVTVAANSNPLIRIGMAQNGVTLIEFPSADKFFAIHAGNSDLVTVEKSPSLRRDHHLVLRAGSGFLVPVRRPKGSNAILPATSIIAQMDSGMAITLMVYPVPLLKQQAHRLVINYRRDDVIAARKAAGLATGLTAPETESQPQIVAASLPEANDQVPAVEPEPTPDLPKAAVDLKADTESALKEAIANPKLFKQWTEERHGLRISAIPPRELNEKARVVVFAVRNISTQPLRLLPGYPDLFVETLNSSRQPVEAGMKVAKIYLAESSAGNLLSPGHARVFALAYEAPVLGAQQHLKLVVAHMSAADEPAMADITTIVR